MLIIQYAYTVYLHFPFFFCLVDAVSALILIQCMTSFFFAWCMMYIIPLYNGRSSSWIHNQSIQSRLLSIWACWPCSLGNDKCFRKSGKLNEYKINCSCSYKEKLINILNFNNNFIFSYSSHIGILSMFGDQWEVIIICLLS